jgi:hypothetical protein
MSKSFKWKKINYKTFLPKHAPVVVYIVAKANTFDRHGAIITGGMPATRRQSHAGGASTIPPGPQKHFMMHAAAHNREFDKRYTQSDVSR